MSTGERSLSPSPNEALLIVYIIANVSLALGGNMHLMPDPDDFSQVQHGLLPPTLSRQHAIERSNLWWSIFLLDSILAFALNVPPQIYHDLLDVRCNQHYVILNLLTLSV